MILTVKESITVFIALFISAYLLNTAVDLKKTKHGVKIAKISARILFPFLKRDEYHVTAVCIQIANYMFTGLFLIRELTGLYVYASDFVQAVAIVALIIVTVISVLLLNKKAKTNKENIKND